MRRNRGQISRRKTKIAQQIELGKAARADSGAPVDVAKNLQILPADGSVPPLPGWTWIHTPGHTPGHVSFWRAGDKTLIAGDAFITTAQESAYAVATQKPEMHGPPLYFTQDFEAAKARWRRSPRSNPKSPSSATVWRCRALNFALL